MGIWKPLLKFALWVLALLAVAAGVLRLFFVDVYVVGHDAMAPSMLRDERVLAWRDSEPEFGRIVICAHPGVEGQFVMGRIVGTAGNVVTADAGGLRINNEAPDVDYTGETAFYDADHDREETVSLGTETLAGWDHLFMRRKNEPLALRETRLGPGQVFLLSDYRSYIGQDSRAFGPVDASTCRATIFMRLAPAAENEGEPFGHGWLQMVD